jgi:hypothetical protein
MVEPAVKQAKTANAVKMTAFGLIVNGTELH